MENSEILGSMPESLEMVKETANGRVYECKCCGVRQKWYRMRFHKLHLGILGKIYRYLHAKGSNEFSLKEIDREIGFSKTEYTNVASLCRFGLLYRPENDGKEKAGYYGMPMGRVWKFFDGRYAIKPYVWRNSTTHVSVHPEDERMYVYEMEDVGDAFDSGPFPVWIDYPESGPNEPCAT